MRRDLGKDVAVALLLAATTLFVYAPSLRHGFLSYDDPDYVTSNPRVTSGLTGSGVLWAFRTWRTGNWHPLTWISHMTDVTLFGLEPGGHHATSLVLHVACVLLLFTFLRRATGDRACSAFVAGLFALHPLHVESVAWIAERKDVLSAALGLLCLVAWTEHAKGGARTSIPSAASPRNVPLERAGRKRRSAGRKSSRMDAGSPHDGPAPRAALNRSRAIPFGEPAYVAAVVFFALGLLAKPMLVSLPLVLLLLDVWPFRRIGAGTAATDRGAVVRALLVEKAPFLLLAAASCLVTFLAQRSAAAVSTVARWPMDIRLENALVAYVRYLGKTLWPVNLAIFYPMPRSVPLAAWLAAAGVLIAATALAVRSLARRPYVATGWFWFAGMLVPVIGLVKVGGQSMADRYAYLPLVGIFIVAAWGLREALGTSKRAQRVFAGVALAACASLAFATRAQLAYWKDSETLYERALNVTTDNALAHYNLGTLFANQGREQDAAAHLTEALRIDPDDAMAHANLGASLLRRGRIDEARAELSEAVRLDPADAIARTNLGTALMREDRLDEALAQQLEAARLRPDFAEARVNLGVAYDRLGRAPDAIRAYEEAVRIDPDSAEAHGNLGSDLANHGRAAEALPHLETAARLRPASANARANLGNVLLMLGRSAEAAAEYREALRLAPGDPVVTRYLERALASSPIR